MTAPFDETGPGGDLPEGRLGPVFLTMRGGHPDEHQRLMFLQDSGYVRDRQNPDPDKRMHEWHYRGNADWWVRDDWSMSEIEKHHRMYVAMARLESASPEAYEALLTDVEREMGS